MQLTKKQEDLVKIQTRYHHELNQRSSKTPVVVETKRGMAALSYAYDAEDLICALLEDPTRSPAEVLGLQDGGWELFDVASATSEGAHSHATFVRLLTPEEHAKWTQARSVKREQQLADLRRQATPIGTVRLTKEHMNLPGADQFEVGWHVQLGLVGSATVIVLGSTAAV